MIADSSSPTRTVARTKPAAQQACFGAFRRCHDEQRPHEALAMRPPAALYVAPYRLREPVDDAAVAVRRVRHNGEIEWRGALVFVSQVLVGEPVGASETETAPGWCATPTSSST